MAQPVLTDQRSHSSDSPAAASLGHVLAAAQVLEPCGLLQQRRQAGVVLIRSLLAAVVGRQHLLVRLVLGGEVEVALQVQLLWWWWWWWWWWAKKGG